MFDTRNNSGCEFGEEVIAYLYGELDKAERDEFEVHLGKCIHCPEHLAAFSSVTNAINEWKTAKFDPLATPTFLTSDEDSVKYAPAGVGAQVPFFEKFREMFFGLPGIWKTASAFGVLALAASLAFIVFGGFLESSEIAVVPPVKEKKAKQPVEVPVVASNESAATPVNDQNEQDGNVAPLADTPMSSKKAGSTYSSNKNVVRERRKTPPRKSPVKRDSNRQIPVKQEPESLPAVPRLTELAETDEPEDNGLRLSELFAGSDSEER